MQNIHTKQTLFVWEDLSKKGAKTYVKLSLIEGQNSLLAVWAVSPLSHLALISTTDSTKRFPCKKDKLCIH